MNHKLEADGINLDFGLKRVLSDVYFKSVAGEVTGLLGKNGSGKSCLLSIIYGTQKATNKSVRFDGGYISCPYLESGLISYLPQFNFIPKTISTERAFSDFGGSIEKFMLQFPEFRTFEKLSIAKLSGGQRRLLEVYLILMSDAKFVMLDEPFSHLMPLHIEKIKLIIEREKNKKGIIITDHMYRQILEISNTIYLISNGKTFLIKKPEDLEKHGYIRL